MAALANIRVLLGVTAGIAAYKSPELVRRLREAGAEVRVVLTPGAAAFITPLTLQAVSGHPVRSTLLDPREESGMDHIELARWADVILVAPATADFLARLAHGLADDLLSTLCLASSVPTLSAPAMNRQMWLAPATRDNCAVLAARGVVLLGPAEGEQACGESGPGRMLEPEAVVAGLADRLPSGVLAGLAVLLTAGPTREAIDPVRFIGNRSSGKMGYAIAAAARQAGAIVTLISGPVALPTPAGVARVDVVSAQQMRDEVMARVADSAIFVAAAAVADYRPVRAEPHKIKKRQDGSNLSITLEATPDILAEVAALPDGPFSVGFAAETRDLERHAMDKLQRKRLDMIVGNRVDLPGLGFESDDNALSLWWPGGGTELPPGPKVRLARTLVELIGERYRAQGSA